jgi:Dolichyl-phosphate-mannose-protein mannosyltransferase
VKSRHVWYAGLILLVLLAVAVRLRLLALPLERDEGEFAYNGQLMLQGIAPYKLAFNMKMPGIYAAYAVIMAIFGESPSGIHFGFLLVNLGTLALLFLLARRLLEPAAVPVCCAAYVLLSLSPAVLGLEGHATNMVVLCALGGLCLLLRARPTGQPLLLLLSGALFGMSFLCKQPGLFFGIFAATLLVRDAMVTRPVPWRSCARNIAWLCLGMVLPLAVTCLVLWRAGTFGRFWFWTIPYARVYGSLQSLPDGMDRLREFFESGCDRWFYLIGTVGLLALFWRKAGAERQFFFAALFFSSFFATAAGLYFRGHYFILMLPVLCLLIGDFLAWLAEELGRKQKPWLRAAPAALFVAASLWLILENRAVWFEMPMAQASKAMYLAEGFVECQEIGNYIRAHSSPQDRVAVFGSEPEIYFYAQRHSVSGYIYMYDLVRDQPYAPAMQREFMNDVETLKPRFLVLVQVGTSWMPWPKATEPFMDWIKGYPFQFYDLAGLAEVDQTNSAYFWDRESIAKHMSTPTSVLLFRRR